MTELLAQVAFETTLNERVDVAVRARSRLYGRLMWGYPAGVALIGSLAVVLLVTFVEQEPAATAWFAGGITLAILAVLLPLVMALAPRIGARVAILRLCGGGPYPVTVTLTADEITTDDRNLRMSVSWANVQCVDFERDRIEIFSRATMFWVPSRAFASDTERSAFLELAQRLATGARASAHR